MAEELAAKVESLEKINLQLIEDAKMGFYEAINILMTKCTPVFCHFKHEAHLY